MRWAAKTPGKLAALLKIEQAVPDTDPMNVVVPPMTAEQVVAIVRTLDIHDVEYVLIGGMAAQLQGVPIGVTRDADFNARQTPENLGRLERALKDLEATVHIDGPADISVPLDAAFLARMVSVQLVTAHGPMDINFRPDGTGGYEDLTRSAVTLVVQGYRVRVAAVEDIVRSKTAAGRAKDRTVLPTFLRWLQRNNRPT